MLFLLYCKVHVSFITFILEDEHELSLGMLMHLKCIHEFSTIIIIFHSYLHHIRVILLYYNDFGRFHSSPIFLELTLHWQKTLFSIFWCFRDLNDVQMSYKFTGIIILEGGRPRSERSQRTEARGPIGGGSHAATVPGRVGPPISALVAPFASILRPEAASWPKNAYIKGPPTFCAVQCCLFFFWKVR